MGRPREVSYLVGQPREIRYLVGRPIKVRYFIKGGQILSESTNECQIFSRSIEGDQILGVSTKRG